MGTSNPSLAGTVLRDAIAGTVVFLVALPLCLGIALASNAPLSAGLIAGIVGGVLVGFLSGSHTSVAGPAAGLTAIVILQIDKLGSFQAFLLAVMLGGIVQIVMGLVKAGAISAFFPTSVIKGLLAAIGAIIILKQIPHLIGHDKDPEGEMSFKQPDHENTFSELFHALQDMHPGATMIGLASVAVLVLWDRTRWLKKSVVPAPLVVVLLGVFGAMLFTRMGGQWVIGASHMVQVPVSSSVRDFLTFFTLPDFSQLGNPAIYVAAFTIALIASLETLLNLEAVDRLDPKQRQSPPNRELVSQGIGNIFAGMIGGLPLTSVIVRSSVNVHAGAQTRMSTIVHGSLLLVCVMFLPMYLNLIPLSCLAAILLMTGIKLASPTLVRQMWQEGRYQFVPFIVTVVAIVMTDLLIGVLIGLGVSIAFILNSNLRRPIHRIIEKHVGCEVLKIELANQVSFLNRAALENALRSAPAGMHVLLDATHTDYIDPDILGLIREFKDTTAPVQGVTVSLRGFRPKYQLQDEIQFVDYSTRELQAQITPEQTLRLLREGNERFRTGNRISRDLGRQLCATANGQHPLAVVLSCIDSRTPAELILDLGLGDIFSVRIAGNVISPKVLGSIEYGCAVVGAKLVLVLGHTRCGAVTSAVTMAASPASSADTTDCQHIRSILTDIEVAMGELRPSALAGVSEEERAHLIDEIARKNVQYVVQEIVRQSSAMRRLSQSRKVAVVGGMYDVATGQIEFLTDSAIGLKSFDLSAEIVAKVP